jgi:hypothetical protein
MVSSTIDAAAEDGFDEEIGVSGDSTSEIVTADKKAGTDW